MSRYCDLPHRGGYLLAEELMSGVLGRAVQVIGITDSITYPGSTSFQRFDYPSRLDASIQQRMSQIAARFVESIGFDSGLFNIEMFYEPTTDRIRIIEVNPRMCPQFADLMEKVNGVNTYAIALDCASGRRPEIRSPSARYAVASSFIFRLFSDQRVRRVPAEDELQRFAEAFPDARLKVLCRQGALLSDELQDGASYRFAVVNLGGQSHAELFESLDRATAMLPFEFEAVG